VWYGIPAVRSGTSDATNRLRNGQVVIVDGNAGTVTPPLPWSAPMLTGDIFGLPIPDAGPVFGHRPGRARRGRVDRSRGRGARGDRW
jgi:hypothetical protein